MQSTRECSIPECEKRVSKRGWCSMHYRRITMTGDPDKTASGRKVRTQGSLCAVSGCGRPQRGLQWCASHYAQHRRGKPVTPLQYVWADDVGCEFCGDTIPKSAKSRKFCSPRCGRMVRAHGGDRPTVKQCDRCGTEFSLMSFTREGHYKRSDTRMCVDCKRARGTRHGHSPLVVVQNSGPDCGICGDLVDLTLKHPHPKSASVDHIIPYARGGSNCLDNLQIACLRCNHIKNDRMPTGTTTS